MKKQTYKQPRENLYNRIKSYYNSHKLASIILACLVSLAIGAGIFYWQKNQEKDITIPLSEAIVLSQSSVFEEMVAETETNQLGKLKLKMVEDVIVNTKDMDGDAVALVGGETVYTDIGKLSLKDLSDMGFVLPPIYSQEKTKATPIIDRVLDLIFPIAIIGLLLLMMSGSIFGLTGTKFKKSKSAVRFSDIGGMAEVKENLREVISFLNDRPYYEKIGAIIPRGILLVGSPGTGKTMLAQAIATEANVPFYYTSGSEFHNMWVGLAALRVKRLFKVANKTASVVFIDEFDSIAHRRGDSGSDAGREWNHTLNQLLSEMDGFRKNSKVVVLAATNRVDALDPAVMRAGRFDRKIMIPLPNYEARCEILKIHSIGKPMAEDVDFGAIAKQTSGLSGADLALLVNEGAIQAAREKKDAVSMSHLSQAIDKVLVGDERKGYSITQEERKLLAYHEAGHAVVASFIPNGDKVQRITILPHGYAGGFTRTSQEKESIVLSKTKALTNIAVLLGGRVAEEVAIGDISSGAQDDIKKANEVAREMVEHYGMSEHFGLRYCTQNMIGSNEVGSDTYKMIDTDINDILNKSYESAKEIIIKNREALDIIAIRLLEVETLDGEDITRLLETEGS